MLNIPIKNAAGDDVGQYEIDLESISPAVNKQLLHDAVVMYEANQRVGTVQTRSRGMVKGSTAKLYRQKGTGRARAGARRTPVRRGGGHTFAKKPTDWSYRLPKKALKLATRMALRSKLEDNQCVVLDDLSMDSPKTKQIASLVAALGLRGKSCLIATESHDTNVNLSSRNIPQVSVSTASDLNAYDLLHQHQLIVLKSALDALCASKED